MLFLAGLHLASPLRRFHQLLVVGLVGMPYGGTPPDWPSLQWYLQRARAQRSQCCCVCSCCAARDRTCLVVCAVRVCLQLSADTEYSEFCFWLQANLFRGQ